MGWQHGRYHGLGMDALAHECAGSRDVIIVLAMDALASVWAGSRNVFMVWAWMHWPMEGLVAWTFSWFGHGCSEGASMDMARCRPGRQKKRGKRGRWSPTVVDLRHTSGCTRRTGFTVYNVKKPQWKL